MAQSLAILRLRLITSRRSNGAIGGGVAAAAIGDGAATAMVVIGDGAVTVAIGDGAAVDGGGGKLPNLRPQMADQYRLLAEAEELGAPGRGCH